MAGGESVVTTSTDTSKKKVYNYVGRGSRDSHETEQFDNVMGWNQFAPSSDYSDYSFGSDDEDYSSGFEQDTRPQLRRRLYGYVAESSGNRKNLPRQNLNSADPTDHNDEDYPSISQWSSEESLVLKLFGFPPASTVKENRFVRIISSILIHKKSLKGKLITGFVKWVTVLTAVISAILYATWQAYLFYSNNESGETAVLYALRTFAILLITIPNITFRKQLQNLMATENSRAIISSVNPTKYIRICLCVFSIALLISSASGYYWVNSVIQPQLQTFNDSDIEIYALMFFHPVNTVITNAWDCAIAILCMIICHHLKEEVDKLIIDLKEDRVLCEIKFATTEWGRKFAIDKYPQIVDEAIHLTNEEKDLLNMSILTNEQILSRYYDLLIKNNASSIAFQKWFLFNICAVLVSIVELLFSTLSQTGLDDHTLSNIVLFCSPLLWVVLLFPVVTSINVQNNFILPNIYPLEERLPVVQRVVNIPITFHVYGQKMSRASIGTFITVLLVGLIGRIWSLIEV